MKRIDLIRFIVERGAVFIREGGAHTIYMNPRTEKTLVIPRHQEISKFTAKNIMREASK